MFTAYFDDSGTHDGSLNVTVGGFVADVDQWVHFTREWGEFLVEFGLDEHPGYFRMADYESRKGLPYEHWDNAKHLECIRRATGIIRRRVTAAIAASFPAHSLAQMRRVLPRAFPKEYAYVTCAQVCWKNLGQWADEHHPTERRIGSVFERGTAGEGAVAQAHAQAAASNLAEEWRMGGIRFDFKKKMLPLQAADFFAYETYKRVNEYITDRLRRRRSVVSIVSKVPVYASFLDEPGTNEVIERLRTVAEG
jgi:hypothetical protein